MHVDHEVNRAGQDTGDRCHGDRHEGQHHGSDTIGPGVVPPTVLVTETDTGALIVQGRPDGPRVYLSPGEAVPLRRSWQQPSGALGRDQMMVEATPGDPRRSGAVG